MPNLPTSGLEAEALAFAADYLARLQNDSSFAFLGIDFGVPLFHPEAAHVFLRGLMKQFAQWSPVNMQRLIESARAGWDDAERALRELIAEKVDRGEPLGAVLSAYNIQLLFPRQPVRRRRGRAKVTFIWQDLVICVLVILLIERFDLTPTRSQLTKPRPSACSVAATALALAGIHRGSEKAVMEIWRRYSPIILPGFQWSRPRDVPN